MERSRSNIKDILIFSENIFIFPENVFAPKTFLIFSQKKASLMFPEMDPCTFQSKL